MSVLLRERVYREFFSNTLNLSLIICSPQSVLVKQRRDAELKAKAEAEYAASVEETKAKREAMVKRCEQYEKEYAQVCLCVDSA